VLAGKRGAHDELAESRGASHRALLPVAGVPMLLRVLRCLRAAGFARVHVSIDAPERLDALPELAAQRRAGELIAHPSADSPSRSVAAVLAGDVIPCLVTTADHALLTPAMVQHFLGAARTADADVLVGVVAAHVIQAAYPDTRRTYLRLRGGEAWSGANLFAFRTPEARRAADFYVRAERFRKQPWRLIGAVGPSLLALYALGRLDLDAGLARASRAIGARVRGVRMTQAEAAIDVDKEGDLILAERILLERERSAAG
jgi:GTP:adenosylcobinamide-phosphate guanylyltransferase